MFSFFCCEESPQTKDDNVFSPETLPVLGNDEHERLPQVAVNNRVEEAATEAGSAKDETPPAVVETAAPAVEEAVVVEPAVKDEPMDAGPIVKGSEDLGAATGNEPSKAEPAVAPLPEKFTLEVELKKGLLGAKFDGVTVVEVTAGQQASFAGIKKGYKVSVYAGESVPEGNPQELSNWLLQKLQGPRPAIVQFERPILEVTVSEGPLGVKFQGLKVIEVTPGQQAENAGVKVGYSVVSFGSERPPPGKADSQLVEWLGQRLAAPRPVVVKFDRSEA
eukprot:TRINITY_DN110640_c0_g1_i1.p1 TRINITY_DN110640_c0_g1~~TRINITY_DN110640_c0_g1_i1.p1  ORF type:complete len:288 (-),score=68.36 TRINITY_DN110640_c0_g1_i1:131-961(-)